jgi:D-aspartate ligase
MTGPPGGLAAAVVLGDMDLVRPLVLADIPVAVVTPPGDSARRSRYTTTIGDWDPASPNDGLVDGLVHWGRRQQKRPVLFYQSDAHLRFVARHEDRLRQGFDFLLDPQAPRMVRKDMFAELAATVGLPVPATRTFQAGEHQPANVLGDLPFPVILKPAERMDHLWTSVEPAGKATVVNTAGNLSALWPRLVEFGRPLVAQRYIPGPESMIESYHVYVADGGHIAAEFTGRKIRTLPQAYGHTTALVITWTPDVAQLGRDVVRALGLTGVAKMDFKRALDGTLHLLEVNPRFTLWHHAAARAGVNVPALVHADLTGRPHPPGRRVRPGVRWCSPHDLFAARNDGVSLARWLPWALGCEAKHAWARDDPMPFIAAAARWARSRARPLDSGPRSDAGNRGGGNRGACRGVAGGHPQANGSLGP